MAMLSFTTSLPPVHQFVRPICALAFLLAGLCSGRLCAQIAVPPGAPNPSAQQKVVEVRVQGNQAVSLATIQRKIRTRAGHKFDMETIEEDVRRLISTRLFVDVTPSHRRVPGGRVVIFEVIERPTLLEVKYVGNNRVPKKALQNENDLRIGDALDPFAIEEGRARIEAYYRTKGYTKAHVSVFEGTKRGDRRAVYVIYEGPKQKILWVHFVGNHIASGSRLKTQIKSKPPTLWLFKGEVDEDQIEEDKNRLRAYYRSLGFFAAEIGCDPKTSSSGAWVTLTFVIYEGPQARIDEVIIKGNVKFGSEELTRDLALKNGATFNQTKMNKDLNTLKEKYGTVGHAFCKVTPDVQFFEDRLDKVNLVYNIHEGRRWRIGKINVQIKGEDSHTRISTVMNRLSLRTGDIFDIRKLRASESRLSRSGLFEVQVPGQEPQIVFSESKENGTSVAGGSGGRDEFRGQSPDVVRCGAWELVPSPQSRPGDPVVDLTMSNPRTAPPQAGPPIRPTVYPVPVPSPVPNPAANRQPVQRPMQRTVRPPQPVWRGQDPFRSDGGWSTPGITPGQSNMGSQVIRPPAGNGFSSPTGMPSDYTTQTNPASPNRSFDPAPYPPANPAAPANPAPAYGNQFSAEPYSSIETGPPKIPGILDAGPGYIDRVQEYTQQDPTLDFDAIVHEARTGRFMVGVGVNSDAGLMGQITIDERNFDWARWPGSWNEFRSNPWGWGRGRGQRFRIEAVPGTRVQRYMASFSDPYLFNTDISSSISGFFYNRRYREYDEERLGGRFSIGYQFRPDLTGSLAFRGEKIGIYNPAALGVPALNEVLGDNALYGFQASLAHDTRDHQFLATGGHLVEFSFEQVIGTFVYSRGELDIRKYYQIHQRPDGSGSHVLSLSGRMGITSGNTPIYDHYYIGGFSTIRGFDYRGASPIHGPTGMRVGGHFMLLGGIQYMFPITADDMLRAVVFCDTGTVEPSIDNWTDNYRVAPGFGLRITVPMMGPAPIALDFAFPISTAPGDREEIFSFFVGLNR